MEALSPASTAHTPRALNLGTVVAMIACSTRTTCGQAHSLTSVLPPRRRSAVDAAGRRAHSLLRRSTGGAPLVGSALSYRQRGGCVGSRPISETDTYTYSIGPIHVSCGCMLPQSLCSMSAGPRPPQSGRAHLKNGHHRRPHLLDRPHALPYTIYSR